MDPYDQSTMAETCWIIYNFDANYIFLHTNSFANNNCPINVINHKMFNQTEGSTRPSGTLKEEHWRPVSPCKLHCKLKQWQPQYNPWGGISILCTVHSYRQTTQNAKLSWLFIFKENYLYYIGTNKKSLLKSHPCHPIIVNHRENIANSVQHPLSMLCSFCQASKWNVTYIDLAVSV